MVLTDTHSHLYLQDFSEDLEEVVKRAISADIQKIVLPNIDSATIENLDNLTVRYPELIVPLMGLHPTHVKNNYMEELGIITKHLKNRNYKGIGEIGIDLYWDKTFLKEQIYVFETQIQLAIEMNLPVVIHARESFNEIFEIIAKSEFKELQGIFHAFTGNAEQANIIINLGFLLGIGGIVTYKNSGLTDVVENIDLNHFVLETDAPFLPPVPYRGKRNESSYVVKVAEKIAEIKGISIEEVANITTENARKIFSL